MACSRCEQSGLTSCVRCHTLDPSRAAVGVDLAEPGSDHTAAVVSIDGNVIGTARVTTRYHVDPAGDEVAAALAEREDLVRRQIRARRLLARTIDATHPAETRRRLEGVARARASWDLHAHVETLSECDLRLDLDALYDVMATAYEDAGGRWWELPVEPAQVRP